jgi:glycosyltransferase involved in cell wall biosynthesis
MKNMDVVVLNDMHPSDYPGAASIALNHANYLAGDLSVEFWHTSTRRFPKYSDQKIKIRSFYRIRLIDTFLRKSMVTRIATEFFPSFLLIKIFLALLIIRPKIVWVNQIGIRIPRIIFAFLYIFDIRTVQTFHDFTVVSPRKLYPFNLVKPGVAILSNNKLINEFYSIRRSCIVKLVNLNKNNICISQMQADILRQFGIKKITIIPNGIEKCECKYDLELSINSKTVLFAGRVMGKGYERICKVLRDNPTWTLRAAGNYELNEIGRRLLDAKQFEYLGFLGPDDLFREVHKVDFVSVISECFDVYPTIALEAFMHGSTPISSGTTGIAQLINQSGCGIILNDSDEDINLDRLKIEVSQQPIFSTESISLKTSGNMYKSIILPALFSGG